MTLIPLVVDDNTNNGEWLKHYLSAILQPMPILFHLYMQLNSDAAHSYQYVGVSSETGRIISINTKQADISESADTLFHEGDYMPTSRSFHFDLSLFDELIKNYIGPLDYSILIRFNKHKHVTLTYHSPTNERPKDYDIFLGYPEKRAIKLIADIYPMIEGIKRLILSV
jgi:hypothetical protein